MKLSQALDYWVGAKRSALVDLSIAVLAKILYYCCSGGEKKKSKPSFPKKTNNHHHAFKKFVAALCWKPSCR